MSANTNIGNANKNVNVIVKFFKEVKAEFKKITWPSKNDIIKTTKVVFATLGIFILIIWLFDSVFGFTLKTVLEQLK